MKHPLIWTLLIISALNCTNQRADVLAIIGKRTVTIDDFATRYKSIRQKMNLPDNGQVRKEIFRNLVNEELLIAEAVSRGYPDDPMGKYEHERLKIQELLNAYLQKIVFKNIPVNEEELKALYIRLNTKIKARHLYAASRKQADSLYSELMKGTSFEQLAKETFTDPQLRDTGGSLGYFTVDEMDPFFEDAAFALDIGEISKPIRTAQGYSIIQVQDRITKPLLTESEYAKHRANLEQYWRYRKMKKLTRSYVDSLRHYLDISFHKPVVSELFQSIKKRTPAPAGVEDRYYLLDVERLDYKELVRSKLGVWEVKTFRQYAQFTSEEQLKWVRNEENLEDFIAGLVVRAYLLSRAKKLGL
ncbi:MAG: peptidylprolyl isomerase, partial [candidate division KSB1 bacterium]|nr:peptidylprolyl isomerase [candidate division KSB1 bacterium]